MIAGFAQRVILVHVTMTIVIPEAAQRLSGIHNHGGSVLHQHCHRGYGFRACAKWRIPE
jgi:hypothetical protein